MNKTIFSAKTHNFLEEFCQKNQIVYLAVFGSFARGEARSDSDIDLLAKFSKKAKSKLSLFDLGGMQADLEENLGRKVDLVLKDSLKPALKPYIEKDLIGLYEKK